MSPAREVSPGRDARTVVNEYGMVERVPEDWVLVRPGDAALTRRVKERGPTLVVVEKRGRKRFSRGVWAEAGRVETVRRELEAERAEPGYEKKLAAGRLRRARSEETYGVEFREAVVRYLNFHPAQRVAAETLANLITEHATPVGSGTVARTKRISLEERAEAATIAWLRHQTTGYDRMIIPRERGRRREIRRMLARRSVELLAKYRSGQPIDRGQCPLHRALEPWLPTRTIG